MTINALFYNVHSREVEDHTGKVPRACGRSGAVIDQFYQGLEDLRHGIIRTPLPPLETFMDDPLRVIRCIRFASRFGFSLVPELEIAARDEAIQVEYKINHG